jgi:hypothetical protein
MTASNGFTQKELNQMIFDKLDDIDKKLDEKLDKSEFYKVLGLVATVSGFECYKIFVNTICGIDYFLKIIKNSKRGVYEKCLVK